jgi:tetratricopeptide (TPR) repeat protein
MSRELEEAATDYSMALTEINYSSSSSDGELRSPLRLDEAADEDTLSAKLEDKARRFLDLLEVEDDQEQVKEVVRRNMNSLELRQVLIPMLERYLHLCGPDVLLYLLIGNLYWNYGEDAQANEYFTMAARCDPENLYVLRQAMLQAPTTEDLVLASRRTLEAYPEDPVARDTMQRIQRGLLPSLSPRAGEHSSIDFVLARLGCTKRVG